MTKLLFFTDYHLHNYSEFAKPVTAILYDKEVKTTDRVVSQLKALDRVFEIANDNKAIIIFGGDFFHKRTSVRTDIYNLGIKAVQYNMDKYKDIPHMYMLVGNHDMTTNLMGCPNSLEPFSLIDRVEVVNEPSMHPLNTESPTTLYFMPYGEDIEDMKHELHTFSVSSSALPSSSILVAHIGVDGASTGNYSHRLSGAFTLDDLKPDVFDYVLLGHYHKRQFLGNGGDVLYGGNLVPNDFSDEQLKGVHLIDLEKQETEFIPIDSPRFLTFDESNISSLTEEVMKNNYVRVQLPEKEMADVESKLSISEESMPDSVRLEKKKSFSVDSRLDIDVTSDEKTIVSRYCDKYCPAAKEKALDILKKAEMVTE